MPTPGATPPRAARPTPASGAGSVVAEPPPFGPLGPFGVQDRTLPPPADPVSASIVPAAADEPGRLRRWWRDTGRPWITAERLLAVAGSVVTLLGMAFAVVVGVRYGWFGPGVRVGALAVLAVGLGLVARRVRPSSPSGSVALAATSAAAGFLLVVAATAVYGWAPPAAGAVVALVVAAAGFAVAARWAQQWLAVLVLVELAVTVPVVVLAGHPVGYRGDAADGVQLAAGLVLAAAAALLPIARRCGWTPARHTSAGVAALALVASVAVGLGGGVTPHAIALLTAVAACAVAVVAASVPALAVALPAILVLAGGLHDPLEAVAVLGLAAAGAFAARHRRSPIRQMLAATAAVLVVEATVIGVGADLRGAAFAAEALVLALVARSTGRRAFLVAAWVVAVPAGALVLTSAATYAFVPLVAPTVGPVVAALLLGAAAVVDLLCIGRVDPFGASGRRRAIAGLATALLASGAFCVGVGVLLVPGGGGFRGGHVATTLVWVSVAAVLLLRHPALRALGFVLVAAGLVKLFTFDLVALDGFYRAGAFTGIGLLLLAAAVRYRSRGVVLQDGAHADRPAV